MLPTSVTVIIPAHNEADSLRKLLPQVKAEVPGAEILVIDDGSTDCTREVSAQQGTQVIRHPYKKGNGAAVKSGLRRATGDAVLIMDADGQHDPHSIPLLLGCLDEYDLVVGARNKNSETEWSRLIYHSLLNALASYLTERPILDATSGFRAAKRAELTRFIHLLPNGFSTPVTTTLAFIKAGYSVHFVPTTMSKRLGSESKISPLSDGARFFLIVFRMTTLFAPMRVFFPTSAALVLLGAVYSIIDMIFIAGRLHVSNTAVLLVTMGILVFLIGLVSEQIASLRFERTEEQ